MHVLYDGSFDHFYLFLIISKSVKRSFPHNYISVFSSLVSRPMGCFVVTGYYKQRYEIRQQKWAPKNLGLQAKYRSFDGLNCTVVPNFSTARCKFLRMMPQ